MRRRSDLRVDMFFSSSFSASHVMAGDGEEAEKR
jgi:hypothetical protein